jgi:hypothetical protein
VLNDNPIISVPFVSRSSLPIVEVLVGPEPELTLNLTNLEPDYQHLTTGQKLLLEWHYRRRCLLNFQSLQNVLRRTPFVPKRFAAAVKHAPPRCEICELAKAKRRPKKSETNTNNPERDGALKAKSFNTRSTCVS